MVSLHSLIIFKIVKPFILMIKSVGSGPYVGRDKTRHIPVSRNIGKALVVNDGTVGLGVPGVHRVVGVPGRGVAGGQGDQAENDLQTMEEYSFKSLYVLAPAALNAAK